MKIKFFVAALAAVTLSGTFFYGCSDSKKNEENTEVHTIEENKISGSSEEMSDAFDGAYQISLLTKGFWTEKSTNSTYQFKDDMSFTCESDADGNSGGNYSVTGSDGYPILNLEYDDAEKDAAYIMSFNSETSLTLTNSDTNKTIQLLNVEKKPENTTNNENSSTAYQVTMETIENTNAEYPVISGWKLADTQESYNSKFFSDVQNVLDEADSAENVTVDFEIKYMDENVLSVVGTGDVYSMGAAHPYAVAFCYNIDMKTGEEIKLADKIDINSASENFINKTNCEIMSGDLTIDDLNDVSMFETSDDVKAYLTDTNNFYIDADGKTCVYFEVPYVMGSYVAVKFN